MNLLSPGLLRRILPLFCLVSTAWSQKETRYELSFPNAVHHEAEVKVILTGVAEGLLRLNMSRSSPGRYALAEFAKNIYNLRVSDGAGHALKVQQLSPSVWAVSGHSGTVVAEYTLYGDRVDGTYAAIDQTHAHLNMPATLLWAQGFERVPSVLKFNLPEGRGWKVGTQLLPGRDGTWSAPNLEWLMDSPAELSAHAFPQWTVEDATFRLALHHQGTQEEADAYARMCQAIVLEEEGVFGRFPKYDGGTYTFLIDYLPYASGDGMEHRDSTVLTSADDLKRSSGRLIETVAHEFFHSWNVKRIRPHSLEPFDFTEANMSGELWFAEGFTNYYGMLTLKRAGFWSIDQFAGAMGNAVNAVLTSPARLLRSAVDMSRLAPFVDGGRTLEPTNFGNTFISYYTYGQALAFGIDLSIRQQFPGKSLDDWMRQMWKEHPDIDQPYSLDDLQSTLGEVTDPNFASGIFQHFIDGKDAMDYEPLLAAGGLTLRHRNAGAAWLGAGNVEYTDGAIQITDETAPGSPLYRAGLARGDKLLRFGGKTFSSNADFEAWLAKHESGDSVTVRCQTRSGQKEVRVVLQENPGLEIVTYENAGRPINRNISEFRAVWLSSKSLHPLPKLEAMP